MSEDGLAKDGRIHLSPEVTQCVRVSQRRVRHHKSLSSTILQTLSPTEPTVHNLPFVNPIYITTFRVRIALGLLS